MSTIKSLRILLRRTMAIALLSLPMEVLCSDDRRIVLALDDTLSPGASELLQNALEELDLKATLIQPERPPLSKRASLQTFQHVSRAQQLLANLKRRQPMDFNMALPDIPGKSTTNAIPHWDLLSHQQHEEDPAEIADFVLENASPGAVLLLRPLTTTHDPVLRALPIISSRLRDAGYEVTTLSELLQA
ncbi:hypothetical protein [Microbulbifer sp. ALW1]|uniref:hypothetical protein n=1 Tax=Microbulbifer sp. (strain ALW1) TaxID=1516059 RepID=UPI001356B692|nr:hypothetical protein [Microbulbifer sp. ALW1]